MDKVTVSKEVAEAIEWANDFYKLSTKAITVHHVIKGPMREELKPLAIISLDTLIRAIYIGYEVEQTPEDKVRELYSKQKTLADLNEYGRQMSTDEAIEQVLDILNIKIEGVNA